MAEVENEQKCPKQPINLFAFFLAELSPEIWLNWGSDGAQTNPKWSKNRFSQIGPKTGPDGQKSIFHYDPKTT